MSTRSRLKRNCQQMSSWWESAPGIIHVVQINQHCFLAVLAQNFFANVINAFICHKGAVNLRWFNIHKLLVPAVIDVPAVADVVAFDVLLIMLLLIDPATNPPPPACACEPWHALLLAFLTVFSVSTIVAVLLQLLFTSCVQLPWCLRHSCSLVTILLLEFCSCWHPCCFADIYAITSMPTIAAFLLILSFLRRFTVVSIYKKIIMQSVD
jgi:hypothetical protein